MYSVSMLSGDGFEAAASGAFSGSQEEKQGDF